MTIAAMTLAEGRPETVVGARSAVYERLSEALAYPVEEFIGSLRSGEWADDLASLLVHVPFGLRVPTLAETDRDLAGEYVNLFEVGVGRPFCPLYEGSHRNGRLKLMEDLVRFYEHFGLKTAAGDHPDHVCAELEFMHYLAFKEAALTAQGVDIAGLRLAQSDFLERHLCEWLPRVSRRLSSGRDVPAFYLSVVEFTEEFCRLDRLWLKEAT